MSAGDRFLRLIPLNTINPRPGIIYNITDLVSDPLLAALDFSEKPRKIAHGGISLGRRLCGSNNVDDNDLFSAPIISRNHAQITVTPSADVYITDLGSLHGTHIYHDDQEPLTLTPYKPVQLLQDDILVLGKTISDGSDEYKALRLKVELRYPNMRITKRIITELDELSFAVLRDLPLMRDWFNIKDNASKSANNTARIIEDKEITTRPAAPKISQSILSDVEEEDLPRGTGHLPALSKFLDSLPPCSSSQPQAYPQILSSADDNILHKSVARQSNVIRVPDDSEDEQDNTGHSGDSSPCACSGSESGAGSDDGRTAVKPLSGSQKTTDGLRSPILDIAPTSTQQTERAGQSAIRLVGLDDDVRMGPLGDRSLSPIHEDDFGENLHSLTNFDRVRPSSSSIGSGPLPSFEPRYKLGSPAMMSDIASSGMYAVVGPPESPVAPPDSPKYSPSSPMLHSPKYSPSSPIAESPKYSPASPANQRASSPGFTPESNDSDSGLVSPRVTIAPTRPALSPWYSPSSPPAIRPPSIGGAALRDMSRNDQLYQVYSSNSSTPDRSRYPSIAPGADQHEMLSNILERLPPSSPLVAVLSPVATRGRSSSPDPYRDGSSSPLPIPTMTRRVSAIIERQVRSANLQQVSGEGVIEEDDDGEDEARLRTLHRGDEEDEDEDEVMSVTSAPSPNAMRRVKEILDSITEDSEDEEGEALKYVGKGEGEERGGTGLGVWYSYSEEPEEREDGAMDEDDLVDDAEEKDDESGDELADSEEDDAEGEHDEEVDAEGEADEVEDSKGEDVPGGIVFVELPFVAYQPEDEEDDEGDREDDEDDRKDQVFYNQPSQHTDLDSEHEYGNSDEEQVKIEDDDDARAMQMSPWATGYTYAASPPSTRAPSLSNTETAHERQRRKFRTLLSAPRKKRPSMKRQTYKPSKGRRARGRKERVAAVQDREHGKENTTRRPVVSDYHWAGGEKELGIGENDIDAGEVTADADPQSFDGEEDETEESVENRILDEDEEEEVGSVADSPRPNVALFEYDSGPEPNFDLSEGESRGEVVDADSQCSEGEKSYLSESGGEGEEEEEDSDEEMFDEEDGDSVSGGERQDSDIESEDEEEDDSIDGEVEDRIFYPSGRAIRVESDGEDCPVKSDQAIARSEEGSSNGEDEVAGDDAGMGFEGVDAREDMDVRIETQKEIDGQEYDNAGVTQVGSAVAERGGQVPALGPSHYRTSSTSSADSSTVLLTPPNLKRKRELALQHEVDPLPFKMPRLEDKEQPRLATNGNGNGAGNMVRHLGLVMLGAVVGSVGTVVGLMQLAE